MSVNTESRKREVLGHKLHTCLCAPASVIKEVEMNGTEVENKCLECWTRAEKMACVAALTACGQR